MMPRCLILQSSPYTCRLWALLLTLPLILLTACEAPTPAKPFTHDGVSFTVPAGWSIDDDAELGPELCFISVTKNGADSSGLMTISWFPSGDQEADDADARQAIMTQAEIMKKNPNYGGIVMEGIRKYKFGNYEATGQSFQGKIMGLEHSGLILCLQTQGKTFIILKQEASEDIEVNKPGFMELERTFKIAK